jgi:thimet oligopeptidase
MKRITLALAAILLATRGEAAAPSHPQLPIPSAETIKSKCDKDLATARARLAAIASGKDKRPVLTALNDLEIFGEDATGPAEILSNVSPDKATRDAGEACTVKFAPFDDEVYQSEALYKRVLAVKPKTAIEKAYLQNLLENFEDSGIALPPAKRERVKAINEKIVGLAKDFERNIREDGTKVTFTLAELEGVPQKVIDAAKRDDKGNLVLGLDYPSYIPVMVNAKSAAARERMWRAKINEGGAKNLDLLDQITELRAELATLYGKPDFATLKLRRKMAGNPKAVMDFLASVKAAVTELEKREIEELRTFKASATNTPLAETKLNRWDVAYFQEQLKKARYSVDQEALRKYFPTEASVKYMLALASHLYGIRFEPRTVPTWQKDVRYVDVFDTKSGKFIGGIYLDLFPRDDKYNHAAVWPVRRASTLAKRTPIPVLVTNLNREGLTQDELETLLHEFGHALHGVLGTSVYNAQAGTSVKRDFVEAPSQMFEEWALREQPLKYYAQVCGNCPTLTKEQIDQLEAARKFGRGIQYSRQWTLASFDMALTHNRQDKTAMDAWKRIESGTPLGYVEGSMLPAGFGHLVGGYAAGYYGYMWSQVLALDMLSAYGDDMLNPKVGRRYRDTILSQGGQKPPEQLVEDFLGRKPNSDAFYKEITGKR